MQQNTIINMLATHSQFANFLLSSKINEQIFGQKKDKEHMIVKVNILHHARISYALFNSFFQNVHYEAKLYYFLTYTLIT